MDLFKIGASHTYALNSFVEYKDGSGNYAGKSYYYSPEHHLNARVTFYPVDRLSLELEADYISRYFTDFANTDTYQRPVLFNMRAAYKLDESVKLWAHAYNLFDTKYAERCLVRKRGAYLQRGLSPAYGPRRSFLQLVMGAMKTLMKLLASLVLALSWAGAARAAEKIAVLSTSFVLERKFALLEETARRQGLELVWTHVDRAGRGGRTARPRRRPAGDRGRAAHGG